MSLVLVGALAACNGDDSSPAPTTTRTTPSPYPTTTPAPQPTTTSNPTLPAPAPASTVMVSVVDTAFQPANITIKPGQTVMWMRSAATPHTVTSGQDLSDPSMGKQFDHELSNDGDSFQFTFNDAGTFPYFCKFHVSMGMKGTVTVAP